MIKFNNVTKIFEDGSPALNEINLEIRKGEYLYVTGKSGAGKSTFLRLLTRELIPDRGEIEVDHWNLNALSAKAIVEYRRAIGIVFQDFKLIDSMTAFENISYRLEIAGMKYKIIKEKVEQVLQMVGLEGKATHLPSELSGGEQQRVAIARAYVVNPKLLLADEPTANLDDKNAVKVIELFKTISRSGATVLIATHDEKIREYFPADCLNIRNNKIFRSGKKGK